jgi:hypothetical protein
MSGLAGDLPVTNTNRDVYEKTLGKGSDVNVAIASVVLHRNKKRETKLSIPYRKPMRIESVVVETHFNE